MSVSQVPDRIEGYAIVSEDGMLNVARLDASALNRGLGREDGDVDGRKILQRSAEGPEWCTDAGQKHDIA